MDRRDDEHPADRRRQQHRAGRDDGRRWSEPGLHRRADHHDTAPAHLKERSIELRPEGATLVGVDEQTALIRHPDGTWRVAGQGTVTLYGPEPGEQETYAADSVISTLKM